MLIWFHVAGLIALFIGLVCWIVYASLNAEVFPDWTGFNTRAAADDRYPARTLWDWLSLLLVPVVLAVGGLLFTWFENRQTRSIERDRVAENQRIERERAQDAVVKDYLDQMTELLLHHTLRNAAEDDEVRSVARARTLTALRNIDGTRRATIVQFLYESRLIGWSSGGARLGAIIPLSGANLDGAWLTGASLDGARLAGTTLDRAMFDGAWLMGASFDGAKLAQASFDGGNLSDCKGLTLDQLRESQSLRGTKLPDYINPADLSDKWSSPKDTNMPELDR